MPFRAPIKVCFGDIDHAGIVYYPRFLHYFHLAFEDFFVTQLGIDYSDVLHKRKVSLPTVHMESDFYHRLEYGDRVDMEVRIIHVGQTSITWGYRGYLKAPREEMVVEGHNVTVCVHTDTFEKIRVPQWLRNSLKGYMDAFENR
jgi:4-hydroxybenzoyl-CoA thioesterase